MSLRLLEIHHLSDKEDEIKELLTDIEIIDFTVIKQSDKESIIRILMSADKVDNALDFLKNQYKDSDEFRVIILPVEASIPRPEVEEETKEEEPNTERISIEEIYEDVCSEVSTFSKTYFVLIILASIVAAIGILYNNIAVIIGSMVIAPLLNPSMALSLGVTLADSKLIKNAILISFLGYFIAFGIGIFFGVFFIIDPMAPEILSRTDLNLMYVILALSGGIAGSVSITRGVAEALVGVMVAVALLPPIVTCGLLVGSLFLNESFGAFLLFSVNLVCINLAGVLTFVTQGINPSTWAEKEKAKKTVWKSITLWILLLVILVVMILVYQYF